MALDLQSLAQTAFTLAKDLAGQAFEPITLRINPTVSISIADDLESTTWEHEVSVAKALRFDESDERISSLPEFRLKNFLVDISDLPDGLALDKINQNSEIVTADGVAWEVYQADVDPTGSAATFFTRRGRGSG
jgi:hypothetical protein